PAESPGVLRLVEDAVDAVGDDVGRASPPQGHDGSPAGERLDCRDTEVFFARLDEESARAVELAKVFGRLIHHDSYGGVAQRAEAILLRALSDEDERPACRSGRRD